LGEGGVVGGATRGPSQAPQGTQGGEEGGQEDDKKENNTRRPGQALFARTPGPITTEVKTTEVIFKEGCCGHFAETRRLGVWVPAFAWRSPGRRAEEFRLYAT